MSEPIELFKFKKGEKFFYNKNVDEKLIYTMIHCNYDFNNPDDIEIFVKPLYSRKIRKIKITGRNVIFVKYYKYRQLDDASFMEGVKEGIKLCKKFMSQHEINEFEYKYNDVTIFIECRTMLNKIKNNIIINGFKNDVNN